MSVNVSRVGEEEGGKREKWKLGGLSGLKNRTHTSPPASLAAKRGRIDFFFSVSLFFYLEMRKKNRQKKRTPMGRISGS